MWSRICVLGVKQAVLRNTVSKLNTSVPKFRQINKNSAKPFGDSSFYQTTNLSEAGKAFKIAGVVSSAIGVGVICYYTTKKGTGEPYSMTTKSAMWPAYVKERIQSTYSYFVLSTGVTALSTVAIFKNPRLFSLATRQTMPAMLLGMAAVIGTGIVARSLPYSPDSIIGMKHVAWLIHCGTIGFIVSPLCLLGGQILQRAALYTVGMVGGLSAVAYSSPSDKYLYMGGPLAMGLGVVFISSLAGMFLNPISRLGAAAYGISLYGGLALFGGFLLYDTQNAVRRAESHPPDSGYGVPPFDPINNCMGIYMDTINIFIRLAAIFGMGGSSKKR